MPREKKYLVFSKRYIKSKRALMLAYTAVEIMSSVDNITHMKLIKYFRIIAEKNNKKFFRKIKLFTISKIIYIKYLFPITTHVHV